VSVSGVLDFEQESCKTQILHFDLNYVVFFTAYTFDTADTIPILDVKVNSNILCLAKSYLLLQQIIGILRWLDFVCTVNKRCEI
jgi:hypothetical protein